jgi:hypothetical protein
MRAMASNEHYEWTTVNKSEGILRYYPDTITHHSFESTKKGI